jgi:hypothetical protein
LGWSIEYSGLALKQLKKLNRSVQADILDYMDKRIAMAVSPRDFGKSLRHDKFGAGILLAVASLLFVFIMTGLVQVGHPRLVFSTC